MEYTNHSNNPLFSLVCYENKIPGAGFFTKKRGLFSSPRLGSPTSLAPVAGPRVGRIINQEHVGVEAIE